ncbi:DUF2272 domain-containing protein [Ramlibacter sp. USB13]|uniref:DUF2272 domain-containing protein n=1 Tax=Ramlibacter cellulosilyticus TaxID=2764187 RepID=A0A923ML47_9BURK|nr:DUF2272 domain-containing protein [Ramlibacter cellulosilyticus]MBC5781520.1 DUF2272 domain-containing protein [Ramlibacter cellulosilyticus]
MKRSLFATLAAALLCACAALPPGTAAARDAACSATAKRAPGDPRIHLAIAEALRQHELFGGQTIERNGGMFRVGQHEAEWGRAPGDPTGVWQRVAAFWQALDASEPPRVLTSQGWVERTEAAGGAATIGSRADLAVREALLRAAIIDTPWSAAFLSYVMKTAGFGAEEFVFSDSHVDYVQASFQASAAEAAGSEVRYAYRACDVATTPPRAGDMLCATRASTAGVASYRALAAALSTRMGSEPFPMHCELVVRADAGGDAKLETIGGNVVQSVTLSRMTLNADKVLGAAYFAGAAPAADCVRSGQECREHLGRRPWAVLMQLRR